MGAEGRITQRPVPSKHFPALKVNNRDSRRVKYAKLTIKTLDRGQ